MSDAFSQLNFEGTFQSLINRIESELEAFRSIYSIISRYTVADFSVRYRAEQVRIAELLESEILEGASSQTDRLIQQLQEGIQRAKRKITSLDQIVQYNLEAAIDRLEREEQGAARSRRVRLQSRDSIALGQISQRFKPIWTRPYETP